MAFKPHAPVCDLYIYWVVNNHIIIGSGVWVNWQLDRVKGKFVAAPHLRLLHHTYNTPNSCIFSIVHERSIVDNMEYSRPHLCGHLRVTDTCSMLETNDLPLSWLNLSSHIPALISGHLSTFYKRRLSLPQMTQQYENYLIVWWQRATPIFKLQKWYLSGSVRTGHFMLI